MTLLTKEEIEQARADANNLFAHISTAKATANTLCDMALQALRAEERRSQWIPIEQRQPDPLEQVLLCWPGVDEEGDPLRDVGMHDGVVWYGTDGRNFAKPSHWMPLPDGPQRSPEKP